MHNEMPTNPCLIVGKAMTINSCNAVLYWASHEAIPQELKDLDDSTLDQRKQGEDADPHLFSLRRLFTATGDYGRGLSLLGAIAGTDRDMICECIKLGKMMNYIAHEIEENTISNKSYAVLNVFNKRLGGKDGSFHNHREHKQENAAYIDFVVGERHFITISKGGMFRENYDKSLSWDFLLINSDEDLTLGQAIAAAGYVGDNPNKPPDMSRELYIYAMRLLDCVINVLVCYNERHSKFFIVI